MRSLLSRIRSLLHVHDHEMVFEDKSNPFAWSFVCSCGDRTDDMETALARITASARRETFFIFLPVILIGLIVVLAVIFA